jgi:hypothetical protein
VRDPATRHDGVAGCGKLATTALRAVVDLRKSYTETVRSVDAAITICPFDDSTISSIGFSGAF